MNENNKFISERGKEEDIKCIDIEKDIGGSTLAIPINHPIIVDGIGLQEYLDSNRKHKEIKIKIIKNRANKINKQISK